MAAAASQATNVVMVDDEWRRWIAENLMLDNTPESIFYTLTAHGMPAMIAEAELNKALSSPYLHGAHRLRSRLAKHDWVHDIRRKLNRLHPQGHEIERRHRLSADEFLRDYYCANRAVIITGMMEDWPALQKWNFDYFRQRCGEREVEVQFGRNSDNNYEINQPKLKRVMKFGAYVDLIEQSGVTNDYYMTANNNSQNKQALAELWQDIVQVPEYLDGSSPDNGFFWFGPAGTRTPFHHDLTNNFMAQVIGRKRVRIMPACELPYVYNQTHCYSLVDGGNINLEQFPLMQQAQVLDCILNPGEILFLPVGCWHYVEGLDVSVTVSFINFRWDNDFSSFYHTFHEV